jgi:cytidylate kinase
MRSVMATVLKERRLPDSTGQEWSPAVDEARALDDEIDLESDRRMLQRLERGPGIFDAWALPWLYREPSAVRIWIAADLPSRVQRCRFSALARGEPAPADPARLLQAKDDFSRERFRRLYGLDLGPSPEIFELVVDASAVLPDPTTRAFLTDEERFHRVLIEEIQRVTSRVA